MSGYSYEPAQASDWLAVATAGRLLVARIDETSDRVARLAATADPEASVQDVLDILTADGLTATGPFALLFWVDGDLTTNGLGVILRGDAVVIVDTADGEVTVSSRGVTTWTEQLIEHPTGFRVDVDPSAAPNRARLPLEQGAAWVRRVSLDAARSGKRARSAPAPEKAPTPEKAQPAASPAPVAPNLATPEPAPVHEETRVFHTTTTNHDPDASESGENEANATGAAEPEADGYDYLFGATVFRPVGAAAVLAAENDDDASPAADPTPATSAESPAPAAAPAPAAPAPAPAAPAPVLGDHDGRTMLASDIHAARQRAGSAPSTPAASVTPPQSAGYTLQLPDGSTKALTAPVILGRAPSVSNVPASVLPHLVTLTGDDISRSHVRVAVEGDTVVVTDLHSSNGTHVIAPGKLPQLLRAGEPTPVIAGTKIDLGSDVLLHVTEA